MTYWDQKVAVVTGGSAGLGKHLARQLASRGAQVALVARNEDQLNETKRELGDACNVFPADVTNEQDVKDLHERLQNRFGRIDALFNCAGKSSRGRILETSTNEFLDLFKLNFLSIALCTRVMMPSLKKSAGHVVNIGSLASKSASRFLGAYPVSKFPVAAYSQQLRLELEDDVHVMLVCPGPIARGDAGSRYSDAKVPASAQRPGGGVRLRGLDPQLLSVQIVTACERRKPELIIPSKARVLFAISQLSPRVGDWLIKKMTRS